SSDVCSSDLLERGQVDELDDPVEGPGLRTRLDRARRESRGALLEPHGVDAREPLEVLPQAAFGEVAPQEANGALRWGERGGLHGHVSSRSARAVDSSV